MIYRADHKSDYVRIAWSTLRDERLSIEARGLLAFMLSLPDNWEFSISGIASMSGLKEASVMRLIKELKSAGYISQQRVHDGKRLTGCRWTIYEMPNNLRVATLNKSNTIEKQQCCKSIVLQNNSIEKQQCSEATVLKKSTYKNEITIKNETNSKNERDSKKGNELAPILDQLEPDLRETFESFIAMRKKIKAPLTDKGLELAIKKAKKLGNNDPAKMKAIVEQSIERSWRGLFELKEPTPISQQPQSGNPFTELRKQEGYI